MLNRAPIFLNCFSRGGSNILWNFFLTHPDACSPIRETLEIFRLDAKGVTLAGLRVAWRSRQLRLFNQWHLQERRVPPARTQTFIDRVLYDWKLKTLSDGEMQYKREDERYSRSEVESARLVTKNNNGLAFLSGVWLEMYPEATFFALVRDPLALYESHKRRGITTSLEAFVNFYETIATRMLADAERLPNYHLVTFEDLLANPPEMMRYLYECAGLDFSKVDKIRLKAKPHFQANGSHKTAYERGKHYWFEMDDLFQILEPHVNRYQEERLDEGERRALRERFAPLCRRLGYQ
jgi:hypothetical protein